MRSILFILIFVISSSPYKLYSQKLSFDKENSKTRNKLEQFLKQNNVPGMAVTISHEGSIIFSEGFGYADLINKTKVDPSKTKFRIASITKTITAATLGKLVELDSIDFDKTANFYLDSLPKKKYDFTIRQLGGHVSGMIRDPSEEKFNSSYSRKDFYRVFSLDELEFEPSTKIQYSNYGYKLLGLIVEEKCEMSIVECQKKYVIDKLGIKNTLPDSGIYDSSTTKFHSIRNKQVAISPPAKCSFKYAEGCYLSTSEDLITLGNSYLYSNRILNRETLKQLIKSQHLKNGDKTNYGVGFFSSTDYYGNYYYGHEGRYVGGLSLLYIYPKEELVVSCLINLDLIDRDLKNFIQEILFRYIDKIHNVR
ncbi:serine hydrolase domain-containing protein [Chryseobacterium rhizosphaerae]|uniref:serine hydrolase domain-containing protein n=1 Tax=Chryseobacterium rhizosphaerae TaxID=395937 RepID=UPI002359768B|nr:serine hydrolase domain-containing protein [Chryseobacterium rhizosphaerae]MDC8102661.1 beta-lactamase family protein [Chryseobacterium rhizosphaerae]